jgi:hypothetical protein
MLFSKSLKLVFLLLLLSCTSSKDHDSKQNTIDLNHIKRPVFTDNDSTVNQALDALNEIQISGNGGMMLYLTFPNISHKECVGEVAHYEITREEFQDALMAVMKENNRHLSNDEKIELATIASQPWEQYKVTACGAGDSNSKGLAPRKGTWIITAIFGTSDLLINWN